MKTNSTIFRHHEKPLSRQAPRREVLKKALIDLFDKTGNADNFMCRENLIA